MNKHVIVLTGAGGSFGGFLVRKMVQCYDILPVLLTTNKSKINLSIDDEHKIYEIKLTDPVSVKETFERASAECGELNVLINNAAVLPQKGMKDFIVESDDKYIKEMYTVNVTGALYCTKYFLLQCNGKKRKIINILAGRALTGHRHHVDYYSSKAGLYNATKTLAADYPNHCFRSIMTGTIGLNGHIGDSPVSMWNYIYSFVKKENPKHYKEIYFKNFLEHYRHIFKYYIDHFKSCQRCKVERTRGQ